MTDLTGDDTPGAGFVHPFGLEPFAPFPHPERAALLGPRLRNRMIVASAPIARQIRKKDHKNGGYLHKTSGAAAGFLALLRDPRGRAFLLRTNHISPGQLEKFDSDEDFARGLALGLMHTNLETRFDNELYKRLPLLHDEDRKVGELLTLGDDYDDDTARRANTVLDGLKAAINAVINDTVRYTGHCLERDFGGLRASDLVAGFVNYVFGLTPNIERNIFGLNPKTERTVRYLCGWEQGRPKADPTS
jgi:hypothetical protein